MRKGKYTSKDISDFMTAYSHYEELAAYFPQLDPKNEEIKKLCEHPEGYWKSQILADWNEISVYITKQMWGSTAGGWGGMGGAAMTEYFNFIIHQKYTDLYFVYWSGKLAYIANKVDVPDIHHIPSISRTKFIYSSKK